MDLWRDGESIPQDKETTIGSAILGDDEVTQVRFINILE